MTSTYLFHLYVIGVMVTAVLLCKIKVEQPYRIVMLSVFWPFFYVQLQIDCWRSWMSPRSKIRVTTACWVVLLAIFLLALGTHSFCESLPDGQQVQTLALEPK